jgi:competence protein ComGC
MKPQKISKKLTLNKTTIATLERDELKKAKGGTLIETLLCLTPISLTCIFLLCNPSYLTC